MTSNKIAPVATIATLETSMESFDIYDDFILDGATKSATTATTHDAVSKVTLTPESISEPLHEIPELPYLSSGMLMTNQVTGKPLHCIHCGRWHHAAERPWWVGTCDLCNEQKTNKSRCSLVSVEWVTERVYRKRDED